MSVPSWADTQDCRTVLLEFLAAIDEGRATEAVPLFTEDAEFDARGQALHGRGPIGEFLADREAETHRQTLHVLANETARLEGATIVLRATLMLYERGPSGSYSLERVLATTQTFRSHQGTWRIEQRRTRPLHPVTGPG